MSRAVQTWKNALCWIFHVSVLAIIAAKVNETVPDPYMDEVFHVSQARNYCQGRWDQWDSKLTTPPGLYLPSTVLSYYFKLPLCSISALRGVNALFVAILPFLIADLLASIRSQPGRPKYTVHETFVEAVSMASFPLVYFFGFLYYTDVASLSMVLLCHREALATRYSSSAFLGLLSLFFRQTNILWVAMIAFTALDSALRGSKGKVMKHLRKREDMNNVHWEDIPLALKDLVISAGTNLTVVSTVVIPYIPVVLAFAAFLYWNGGIVLGDKSMHIAVLHLPQLYYFSVFSAAFVFPFLLDGQVISRTVRSLIGSPTRFTLAIFISACLAWTIKQFTYEHPFLLADNRHYPFYIWRKILNRYSSARYLAVPAYIISGSLLYNGIVRAKVWTLLPFIAFLGVTAVTLVPSPLLEFRYFIVPFLILRLHLKSIRTWQLTSFQMAIRGRMATLHVVNH